MKVLYLGTGAAEGIPAPFCNCKFCKEARARREVRSRSQVIIDGELSLDFPPDAFYHAALSGVDFSALKYLAVTHSHMDHFYAHDFILRGYKYAAEMTSPTLDIYGNEETLGVFEECTRRELKAEVRDSIRLHPVKAFETYEFGGYRLTPIKARHSSREPLLYALEKGGVRILHLTDTGVLPEEDFEFLATEGGKPFSLITLDCTFLFDRANENARHLGLHENAETLARLEELGLADGNTRRVITHFSHNGNPSRERLARAEAEYGVTAAYDGMALDIS